MGNVGFEQTALRTASSDTLLYFRLACIFKTEFGSGSNFRMSSVLADLLSQCTVAWVAEGETYISYLKSGIQNQGAGWLASWQQLSS